MQENDGKYIFGTVKPGDSLMLIGDQNGMALVKTEIFQNIVSQVMEGLSK